MNCFAFVIHPIEPQKDVARKFPVLGKLPPSVIDFFSRFFPPVRLAHITGVRSDASGQEIEGWLLACPLTPKQMLQAPLSTTYHKIVQTGRLAERLGARLLGLGAFTSVVGDAGITVSNRLSIPVTTGHSYTVALTIEAVQEATTRMDVKLADCSAAIVGASGSLGKACSQLLARIIPRLILIGRQIDRLQQVQHLVESVGTQVVVATDLMALSEADLVVAVSSATTPIIKSEHLKRGAIVCDVARPPNVHPEVRRVREDVLLIDGGVVDVPGEMDLGFDIGLPPGIVYGCMAETMILTLEGRYERFTLGKELSLQRVAEIAQLAWKHGFRISNLYSLGRIVTSEMVERVRKNTRQLLHGRG